VLRSSLASVDAVVIQSLSTVLSALDRIPEIAGKRAAVIGQGPLGLLFSHALKTAGAAEVIGVDRVDRSDVADRFGVDTVVWDTSEHWANTISDADRPDLVIEAVGHQVATVNDAIEAVRPLGRIYAFGVPDSTHYPLAFQRMFRKHVLLHGGNILQWHRFLLEAETYLVDAPKLAGDYLTHVFPVTEAQQAFETAVTPKVGRIKVALVPPGRD
jgi:threonine dehydrogenase-like Zn-dependent dehydrogenase